ncbi:MAG: formate dehydrogenase accessory sulfurtransferase FdhD [Actinomycetota bacterium]|nr:formate dehydrogenase accessory sulfurtransferase FdhD [Actinomycetota bacterium]
MARGRTRSLIVQRWQSDGPDSDTQHGVSHRAPDDVVVEEPMQIRLDDHLVATTMRTPGHDYELAVGFCFTDGALAGAPVLEVRYCATGSASSTEFNIVSVSTGGRAPIPQPRLTTTTSSCGLCGSVSLDELRDRLHPLEDLAEFAPAVLAEAAQKVVSEQSLFSITGGVHAAAAFGLDGSIHVVREDIGRHNAVDKVVGRLLLDGRLPASRLGLFVSGRASFEIVQKAWAAGFAAIVAVSAPSSMAVEAARVAGLTLAGFARPGRMNIYVPV